MFRYAFYYIFRYILIGTILDIYISIFLYHLFSSNVSVCKSKISPSTPHRGRVGQEKAQVGKLCGANPGSVFLSASPNHQKILAIPMTKCSCYLPPPALIFVLVLFLLNWYVRFTEGK